MPDAEQYNARLDTILRMITLARDECLKLEQPTAAYLLEMAVIELQENVPIGTTWKLPDDDTD